MKDEHPEDVAIQYRVLSQCGLHVASCHLAHVNRNYVYQGGDIDPWRFFRIRNLTRKIQTLQSKLVFQLRSEFRVLEMSAEPILPTGKHCVQPTVCQFFDHCNPSRPTDHIGFLPYIHASAVEELKELGIGSIRDIPGDYDLTEIQRRAATCVQTEQPWFSPELAAELGKLEYPLYFMDFETMNPAIPRFLGVRPYDHLPFQWSLHVQRQPGAELEHYEFLNENGADQRREFTAQLCDVLGERGSIVVYNQQFESTRLSELAEWLPEFAEHVKALQARLYDLLPIVRSEVYHPAFGGSYSLKTVLPALVPEMSYKGMEVADGVDAGLAWEMMVRTSDVVERGRLRKALLDYCGQDTLALVKLLETLRRVTIDVQHP